jgi:PAS domain S-box-containing protein
MSDHFDHSDTSKIRTIKETAQDQIRQLIQRTEDLTELLRAQRDVLRQRGMNLPPGSLDKLKAFRQHLDKLNIIAAGTVSELKNLRELAGTTSLVNSSLETQDVLNRVMDTVIRITGAERGYIALIDPASGDMIYPVQRGIDGDITGKGELVVSTSVVKQVAETGAGIITENASQDKRFQGQQSVIGFQLRSILAVPLKVRDDVIGVVYCDNRIMSGLFKPNDLNLLTAFANQAAVAIQNARLFEELQAQVAQTTQASNQMTSIFSSIASGVITLNRGNTILDCNPTAESIVAIERRALIGRTVWDAIPFDDLCVDALSRVRELGTREQLETKPIVAGIGNRIWNVIMSPLRDSNGLSQGVVLVLDDLTDIRRREEQISISRTYSKLPLDKIRQLAALDKGGEVREISVLHSDVRGFTTFSETLEPEVLMEIINRYISLASDAIDFHGGVIDKYLGDAVTGLFNTPFNPQEDHALRAVRSAFGLITDLRAMHETLPVDQQQLYYGIGVHTGMAVLGNIGGKERKEFGALGDAPDLAKLLQENAEHGEVLISAATYELVKDFYECEALQPRKTTDYTNFTVMYRVTRYRRRGITDTLTRPVAD